MLVSRWTLSKSPRDRACAASPNARIGAVTYDADSHDSPIAPISVAPKDDGDIPRQMVVAQEGLVVVLFHDDVPLGVGDRPGGPEHGDPAVVEIDRSRRLAAEDLRKASRASDVLLENAMGLLVGQEGPLLVDKVAFARLPQGHPQHAGDNRPRVDRRADSALGSPLGVEDRHGQQEHGILAAFLQADFGHRGLSSFTR